MWLQTHCELHFSIQTPTPFILMLRPRSGPQQWVASEQYLLSENVEAVEFRDNYGNLCQRLLAPPGDFRLATSARVRTRDHSDTAPGGRFVEVQNLPDSVLPYLLPSRFCESDRFGNMAQEITAHREPGYDQVEEIQHWLERNLEFRPLSSYTSLSAIEVNLQQSGVCRDFSHLAIALCRGLSIPARLVVGYLYGLEPMELHAWFEAYVDDHWYSFDATQRADKGAYVAVGYGRDAADVAVYNQFGPQALISYQKVSVELTEPDRGPAGVAPHSDD